MVLSELTSLDSPAVWAGEGCYETHTMNGTKGLCACLNAKETPKILFVLRKRSGQHRFNS